VRNHRLIARLAVVVCALLALVTASPVGAAAADPDDPLYPKQWNLGRVGAPWAWESATGEGVIVGVVDTGIDLSHPDLGDKVVATAECLDGGCRDGGGQDDNGHGTEVSGIVAATTDNSRGIAAVAPDAQLVVAKALDADGAGQVDDINNGIRWVVDHGAKVVNLSLGDEDFELTSQVGTPLRPALDYAWSRGAVPVLASGNYRVGDADVQSPNYGDVNALVVGATTRSNEVAPYSTVVGNAKWGVAAPGGVGQGGGVDDNIITTDLGGGYAAVAGTSASAPHVSGALAVLMSMGLGADEAVERILVTLDTGGSCGNGCQGRLDLEAAVASGGPTPAPAPATTTPTTEPVLENDSPPTGQATAVDEPVVSAKGDTPASPGRGRNSAIVVIAGVLVVGMAAATGSVGVGRLRGGGRLRAGGGW